VCGDHRYFDRASFRATLALVFCSTQSTPSLTGLAFANFTASAEIHLRHNLIPKPMLVWNRFGRIGCSSIRGGGLRWILVGWLCR
jgi:hypothetical protein